MAELIPYPFGKLVTRTFRELDRQQTIFDLPARRFFLGGNARDFSVRFHGKRASTPLGPSAGPHSQMAQNIVLSWLGGSRIIELKTVQILDELDIPRPCIDVRTVGYNVEWSQELKLEQSLEEYVKAAMLIEMLRASGKLPLAPGAGDVIYDLSVGYDLAGIRSERVQAFLHGMRDARPVVERLRAEIPAELRAFRDLDFATRLSDTLTLSTFHGCPSDEIERIIEFLMDEHDLHCVVKLNPTLLGAGEVRRILHDVLGYHELHTPDEAFAKDTQWDQAAGFVDRLQHKADALGLGFGVKLTNTLVVDNHLDFFPPTAKEMYVSGPPLHVLAMHLVRNFRRAFSDRIPLSFSAGIDRHNFADAVALGLCPITACTDLLRPGGYARQQSYLAELEKRMAGVAASDVSDLVLKAHGQAEAALDALGAPAAQADALRRALRAGVDPRAAAAGGGDEALYARWIGATAVRNTELYVDGLEQDARYTQAANEKTPKKIGSRLELFDCVTCDICVPVCPNDANFTFVLPRAEIPVVKLAPTADGFVAHHGGTIAFAKKHQIGNVADFCNECGNCDVFCPEDGGPYVVKPRFFGSRAAWEGSPTLDGFFLARAGGTDTVLGRVAGKELRLTVRGDDASYRGDGFDLRFSPSDPTGTVEGRADVEVDLTWFHIMDCLREAILADGAVSYLNP